MNGTIIGIVILVVVLIVGPFATLRAVSYVRSRRAGAAAPARAAAEDQDEADEKSGFW